MTEDKYKTISFDDYGKIDIEKLKKDLAETVARIKWANKKPRFVGSITDVYQDDNGNIKTVITDIDHPTHMVREYGKNDQI